jgi:predicted ATPase
MIRSIKLKFGKAPSVPAESITTTPVTVFVGPNNSGKSKLLLEINQFCSSGNTNPSDVILDKIEFKPLSAEAAEEKIQKVTLRPNLSEMIPPPNILVGKRSYRAQVPKQELINSLIDPNGRSSQFCQWYLTYNTLILDGKNRISLVNQQNAGDLQQSPQMSFQVLFRDDQKRKEVRRIIYDSFNLYFVVDPTFLGNFRIRLSKRPPSEDSEERGLHEAAIKFHSDALLIDQASDGTKSFIGIITEVIAGDPTILLIDEPEAFLHPSLATNLGKEISIAISGSEKRLFVSTHSPNFVMGCIQSGAQVTIVRLTYRNNVATARVLPKEDILRLMRNPLLRSTNVLNGLFYDFVIVTESDTDRAFYQEINERLLRFKPDFGIPNCLFINAQNKQTIQTIIKPLRELGIPTLGIVDIDILKNGGTEWTSFLESGFVPVLEHQPLGTLRSSIKLKFESSGKDMKRDGGIQILSSEDRDSANHLFDRLAEYGLFVVRKGELESWLSQLGVPGHGSSWLIEIFRKMGDEPESAQYLKPSEEDVWLFLFELKRWLIDPNRKGIPV